MSGPRSLLRVAALLTALPLVALVFLVACDGDEHGHDGSGAVCPTDSALTYASFGKDFVETYCTSCHSSELVGDARHGAPGGHDFDSLAGIQAVADHIDEAAAAGPDNTFKAMPVGDPKPTLQERKDLGEWLACGAP
jgi:uncharacterized membrane protein